MVHPYSICNDCDYISQCPHPTVDENGKPIEPNECLKKGEIKLENKPDDI